MKRKEVHGKWIGMAIGVLLIVSMVMPVGAAGLGSQSVSDGDGADYGVLRGIPQTVGMSVTDAEHILSTYGEVILNYRYSVDVAVDVVMEQVMDGDTITLTVSLGREPQEDLYTTLENDSGMQVNKLGAFGLSAYSDETPIAIDGDFSDWDNFPAYYDYDWNNKNLLWGEGIWVPGIGNYKLPYGELDDVAENKFGFVVYGDYLYIHAKRAVAGGASFYFTDYQIIGNNGEYARFDLHDIPNGNLTLGQGNASPGVHEISVVYVRNWESMNPIEGAKAYLRVNDDLMSTEVEMRIPLSALPEDWPLITWENAETLQFYNAQMMKAPITASGAGTAPFAAAAIALLGVPVGVTFLRRKRSLGLDKGTRDE